MRPEIDHNKYLRIVQDMLSGTGNRDRIITTFDEYVQNSRQLTIDRLISLIYSMFQKRGWIVDENNPDVTDKGKFIFTAAYPDNIGDVSLRNVVTYDINERKPARFESKAVNTPTFRPQRPTYLCEVKDVYENELALFYMMRYENLVQFTCWSEKSEDARELAAMIENFFVAFYAKLRNHLHMYEYIGRRQTITSSDYGEKRLFGVPLLYNIFTDEVGFIRQSEIVSIETDLRVVNSSIQEDILKLK